MCSYFTEDTFYIEYEKVDYRLHVCDNLHELKIKYYVTSLFSFWFLLFAIIIYIYKLNDKSVKLKCITYTRMQILDLTNPISRLERVTGFKDWFSSIFKFFIPANATSNSVKMNERLTVRRACLLLKIRHDKKSIKKKYSTMIFEFYRRIHVWLSWRNNSSWFNSSILTSIG